MFPEDYLTYTNRGIAYRATGRYDLALADFARAIELAPNEAGGYTSLGSVYEETGDYQLALAEYDKVVEILPDNSQGYIGRAGVSQPSAKVFTGVGRVRQDYRAVPRQTVGACWPCGDVPYNG